MQETCYYVDLSDAADLLEKRSSLIEKVEALWRESSLAIPDIIREGSNLAFLARQVPTFRYEDAVFAIMAEMIGLRPAWLGYAEDQVAFSAVKKALLAPKFVERFGRKGGANLTTKTLASIHENIGMPLSSVSCNGSGSSLVDFHRSHLEIMYPPALVHDFSEINTQLGKRPDLYYFHFLSLAISHGVLFESFHAGESGGALGDFTRRIFEPAFEKVTNYFGVKPLIVPMPWWQELAYYPSADLNAADNWKHHESILREFAVPRQGE